MYAIVDIETTGSYAANNGITELAIVLHDGNKITDRFETLINPRCSDSPLYSGADRYPSGYAGGRARFSRMWPHGSMNC